METLLEAMARLRSAGFAVDLVAGPSGSLRCSECGSVLAANTMTLVHTVRFEGDSNPDDQAILTALVTPCGHRGLFSAGYGPAAASHDSEALRGLAERRMISRGDDYS
jgi:hypothetical protein